MNLIKGDCLVELKKLKNKSVDFVFLDLPYGQTACDWDKKIDLNLLWIELKRIAKNDRTPFFFTTTTKFGYELIKANEKWFRWDLVWEKNRAAGFLNAYRLPMRKHEMVYCFAKKSPAYDVSSHNEGKSRKIKPTKPKAEIYGMSSISKPFIFERENPLPTSICPPQDEQPSSWCKFSIDQKTGHRTAKPIKLMEYLLKYWSKEGDTILDPTMGSGSMGIACKNMNRKFIGIELNEDIYHLGKKRINDYTK
mgnify:CR=1 FL=1